MTKSDLCITTLRVTLFIDPVLKQQRKIEYHSINKEQLSAVLQTAKNNVAINSDIIIDKVVVKLGVIPRQHFSIYFYQRLQAALVQLFTQLASHARNAPLSRRDAITGNAPVRDGQLVTEAIACLQSGGAKTAFWHSPSRTDAPRFPQRTLSADVRYGRHSRYRATPAEALYYAFARDANDYFAASVGSPSYTAITSAHPKATSLDEWRDNSPTAPTRLTPLRLAHQALSYLLTVAEGRHWLSQHSMTHAQRDAWAAALVQQEIPHAQFLQLIELLEPIPIVQARAIAGRWVIPLWRDAGVARTVHLHAGKAVQQQIDDYLASLLPETLAAVRSHWAERATSSDGNHSAYGQVRQSREALTAQQRQSGADIFTAHQTRPDGETFAAQQRQPGAEAFTTRQAQQNGETLTGRQAQQRTDTFIARKTPQSRDAFALRQSQQSRNTTPARRRLAHRAGDEFPEVGLPVSNAGVVLLWPLLPQWFTALGLVAEKQFISDDARWQAVAAIDWLVWEAEQPQAQRVVVNQFLCGLPLEEPPAMPEPLSAQQQQITSEWAASVFSQIAAFEKMGLTDIRQLFLQRPGELFSDVTPAVLHIQPEVFDILLTKWSWPLNLAFFPWFDAPLLLEWLPGDPGGMLP
ncbi:Hypothetical protein AKI40_0079 [Enterobacter sp. FY-07]|uniref:contractile injection system tape measure protein n=1 Tax=Kosakonia oryzendophytica TaxID=1005665 RepID=UPI0007778F6E|nr:contractile injection system tape measure protein [Kosakonia oryzendophytica]AMO46510.1 Hypothetical protein AKI40_0079 [Enterobacter sp. FY-07]WBT58304.1 contractile injection system tape measure protein [Kosakonia oryzendophytica]